MRELGKLGATAMALTADVTDEAAVGRLVQATQDRFGRVDILINNAGTNIRKSLHEYSLDEWHRVMNTNLTSAFLCSRAVYPAMKAAGGGKVSNDSRCDLRRLVSPASGQQGWIVQRAQSAATRAPANIQVTPAARLVDTSLTHGARARCVAARGRSEATPPPLGQHRR